MEPEIRYKLPRVKEIMSSPVIALTEKHTIFDALATFNKYRFSAIPVVADDSRFELTGVISEGDCLKYLSHNLFFDEMNDDAVAMIMKKDVKIINREMDIFELEEFFQQEGIRHAPVVENGKVMGTVSRSDILKHLEKFTQEVLKYRHDVKEPLELSMYKEMDTRIKDFSEKHRFGAFT